MIKNIKDDSIDVLNLSESINTLLKEKGINRIKQLSNKSVTKLINDYGFSIGQVFEIMKALREFIVKECS